MATNLSPSFAPHLNECSNIMGMLESKLLQDLEPKLDGSNLWKKMAMLNRGKTPREFEEELYAVLAEHSAAMLDLQHFPGHLNSPMQRQPVAVQPHAPLVTIGPLLSNHIASLQQALPDRSTTKGLTWSDEEHRLFLLGMGLCGKGDWSSISKHFVLSRTPSQVTSHAQKFFNRKLYRNNRRRAGIHDLTSTMHFQNPFGYFQKTFNDGRIDYLRQLQMSRLGNRYVPYA